MRRGGVVIAAVVAVSVGAVSAGASSRTERADKALRQALHQLAAAPGGPPGVVAVIQRGRQRVTFTAGVADTRTRARISLRDHWRIASVSKAFSGAVALQLVQQGKLSLNDTIAKRLRGLPKAWGKVTLAQALQHTSGLPDYAKTEALRKLAASRRPASPRMLLSFVAKLPLEFKPGTRYEYSNTDNVVAAMFAQAATGLSYERLLSELVLDPLAMRSTSMPFGYRMVAPYVHGYAGNEDVSELLNATLSWASGGLVSTPNDLTAFIRAYAGGGLIGDATRLAQLSFRPGSSFPPGPGTTAAGLAIFRYRTACGTVYGHTGNTPGYTTFIAASADGKRSAVLVLSTQLSSSAGSRAAFRRFRAAEERAVCAALT